jgi:flagellar biosynthetic protein FlhB
MLKTLLIESVLLIALTLLLTFIAALAPAILQGKWVFSTEQMKPKLKKISPMAGLGRLFGKKALVEFFKNFLKILTILLFLKHLIFILWKAQTLIRKSC